MRKEVKCKENSVQMKISRKSIDDLRTSIMNDGKIDKRVTNSAEKMWVKNERDRQNMNIYWRQKWIKWEDN